MSEANDKRRAFGLQDAKLPDYPLVTKIWASPAPKRPKKEAAQPTQPETPEIAETEATVPAVVETTTPSQQEPEVLSAPPINKTESVNFVLGDYRFEFGRAIQKLNITQQSTMRFGQVAAYPSSFQSFNVDIVNDNGRYVCQDWNMTCTFDSTPSNVIVSIFLADLAMDIRFQFDSIGNQP
jgi:hypothetical protein